MIKHLDSKHLELGPTRMPMVWFLSMTAYLESLTGPFKSYTSEKLTYIAPETLGLENKFPFGMASWQGRTVSFRKGTIMLRAFPTSFSGTIPIHFSEKPPPIRFQRILAGLVEGIPSACV